MSTKRELTARQAAFVDCYTDASGDTYNNATQSAIKAGYSRKTANKQIGVLLVNAGIKQAIAQKLAKKQEKADYKLKTAMAELDAIIDNVRTKAKAGYVQANQVLIAVTKEKAELVGLHKQRFVDETPQQRELDASMAEQAEKIARELNRQAIAEQYKLKQEQY